MFDSFYIKFGGLDAGKSEARVIVGFSDDGEDRTDVEVPVHLTVPGDATYDEIREAARSEALRILKLAVDALASGSASEITAAAERNWADASARSQEKVRQSFLG